MRTKRWRVTEEMPEPTRIKNGLKVGDLVPERWGENQLQQWIRLGRVEEVVVDVSVKGRPTQTRGGSEIETTQGDTGESEEWPLKTSPQDYLDRYPNGPKADLAKRLLD